jgi:hypothetical protein
VFHHPKLPSRQPPTPRPTPPAAFFTTFHCPCAVSDFPPPQYNNAEGEYYAEAVFAFVFEAERVSSAAEPASPLCAAAPIPPFPHPRAYLPPEHYYRCRSRWMRRWCSLGVFVVLFNVLAWGTHMNKGKVKGKRVCTRCYPPSSILIPRLPDHILHRNASAGVGGGGRIS